MEQTEQNITPLRVYCQKHKINLNTVIEIIKRVPNNYNGQYSSFTIIGPDCGNPLANNLAKYISIHLSEYRIMLFSNESVNAAQIKCAGGHDHEVEIITVWADLANKGLPKNGHIIEDFMVILLFESLKQMEELVDVDNIPPEYHPVIGRDKLILSVEKDMNFNLANEIRKKIPAGQTIKIHFVPLSEFETIKKSD